MNELLRADFQSVVEAQPDDLKELMNSNVIFTGASGFVGKWFVGTWLMAHEMLGGSGRLLLTCRHPEFLVEEFPELDVNPRVTLVASDIRSFSAERSFRPRLFIHAATAASESLNNTYPLEMIDVIVGGTQRALNVARYGGAEKFIFLSSGAVYGSGRRGQARFSEKDVTGPDTSDPKNAYHEAKRLAELIVRIESNRVGYQAVSLRLFSFLAPFLPLNTHFAAGNFVLQAVSGSQITVKSGGGSIRSYQYGSDLLQFVVASSVRTLCAYSYNIGSPDPISIKNLAHLVRDTIRPSGTVVFQGIDTEDTLSTYVPDTHLIENELSIRSTVTLQKAIIRTSEWLLARNQQMF